MREKCGVFGVDASIMYPYWSDYGYLLLFLVYNGEIKEHKGIKKILPSGALGWVHQAGRRSSHPSLSSTKNAYLR